MKWMDLHFEIKGWLISSQDSVHIAALVAMMVQPLLG